MTVEEGSVGLKLMIAYNPSRPTDVIHAEVNNLI